MPCILKFVMKSFTHSNVDPLPCYESRIQSSDLFSFLLFSFRLFSSIFYYSLFFLSLQVNRQIKGDSPIFDEGSFDHGSGIGSGSRNPRTYRKGTKIVTNFSIFIPIWLCHYRDHYCHHNHRYCSHYLLISSMQSINYYSLGRNYSLLLIRSIYFYFSLLALSILIHHSHFSILCVG